MPAPTIAVLQTFYKRTKNFEAQLSAIKAQSVAPAEMAVWYNHHQDADRTLLRQSGVRLVGSENYNWGVWPRFLFCMEFEAEYVCVFDDDTVPGKDWFANCLKTMEKADGLLGTIGVIFPDGTRKSHRQIGWARPNSEIRQADIVGHSWFFRRDWLRYYALEPRRGFPTCGEDYHFSVALQKHLNKGTYVPPHPPGQMNLWGSIRGKELSDDGNALWTQKGERDKKQQTHAAYRQSGWKTLFDQREVE